MENYYVTYKFYDENQRRLAIFAIPKKVNEDSYLEVFVVTCSNKDKFSKWKAKKIFEGRSAGDSLKGYFQIELKDPSRPKWTFIKWCEANYFKMVDASFIVAGKIWVKDEYGENPQFLNDISFIKAIEPFSIEEKEKEVASEA